MAKTIPRYRTAGNYAPPPGDEQDPTSKTEQTGYVPPKLQIEMLTMAGKNLKKYRQELFDLEWQGDLDPEDIDVIRVRDRGYDIADAFQDSLYIKMKVKEEKLKRKHHALKQKEAEEKNGKPSDIPPDVEPEPVVSE